MWNDNEEESCGFADPLFDGVMAIAGVVLIALAAILVWYYQTGTLLLWGVL